jgi:carboxyl-terminal processing protease
MDDKGHRSTLEKVGTEQSSCASDALYEDVLNKTRENFIDPTKTANFPEKTGNDNCQFKSHQDAVDAANRVLETMGDPYTRVLSRDEKAEFEQEVEGGSSYVSIGLHLVSPEDFTKPGKSSENAVVELVFPGGPADKAGLKAGDIITSVDGKSTNGLNQNEVAELLGGSENSRASLKVDRGGKMIDLSPIREELQDPSVVSRVVGDDVLYLRVMDFLNKNVDRDIKKAMKDHPKASAFIVDLRGNPGGFVNESLESASLFMQTGNLYYQDERLADSTGSRISTGTVNLRENDIRHITPSGETVSSPRNPNLAGNKPIVVLADGGSASAAELFVGALSDNNRAKFVGETTYGKGIMERVVEIVDGAQLNVTTARYRTPSGRWPGDASENRFGILPDIEVKQEPFYVPLSAADKQFRKALETVEAMAKSNH